MYPPATPDYALPARTPAPLPRRRTQVRFQRRLHFQVLQRRRVPATDGTISAVAPNATAASSTTASVRYGRRIIAASPPSHKGSNKGIITTGNEVRIILYVNFRDY